MTTVNTRVYNIMHFSPLYPIYGPNRTHINAFDTGFAFNDNIHKIQI